MLLDFSYKAIVEGILFIADAPISKTRFSQILDIDEKSVEEILYELKNIYSENNSGIVLREVAGGYQFVTASLVEPYIEKMFSEKKAKLSPAAYETLSIIAYKQPITRSQIETIRGVKSDAPLQQLLMRNLIEEKGRLDQIGRPVVFGTTQTFLAAFGLYDLTDLPKYQESKEFNFEMLQDIEKDEM